jgi:hypothetical protein
MNELTDERAVVDLLLRRACVVVQNLSFVANLPTSEYLAAIQVLDEAIDRDIPESTKFMVKMCFSDTRARKFYRRIFGWWVVSQGDVERFSLELALARTYSKSQCVWTWEQLQAVSIQMWPMSVIRLLWKDGAPKAELRQKLLQVLDSGISNVITLREISKIDDMEVRQWFERKAVEVPEMARWIRADSKARRRADVVMESELVSSGLRQVFSVDVDDVDAERIVCEVNEQLGWGGTLSALNRVSILRDKFTVVWKDGDSKRGRVVVATRDDDTTLIIKWFAKDHESTRAVVLS